MDKDAANPASWVCCQLGAREHYAVPRALHQAGRLHTLYTDTWVAPGAWVSRLGQVGVAPLRRMAERYHPQLAAAPVVSFNLPSLAFELRQRLQRRTNWEAIIARNHFYQAEIVARWRRGGRLPGPGRAGPVTLFAYSYAALELLRFGKAQGWRTVLGQIDPGPAEEAIVQAEHARHPQYRTNFAPAPAYYWQDWREECALADLILVNSPWSRDALVGEGIPAGKLSVVPLAYEPGRSKAVPKRYPPRFDEARPLRVLFLGQINLRKGVARLLEAARMLRDESVEFWMVGPVQIDDLARHAAGTRCRWMGAAPRQIAASYYEEADVFVLPTLSDGFALTQLEAFEQRLPVIASAHCGQVVRDGIDGRILPVVSAEAIADAVRGCLESPERLAAWSAAAAVQPEFTLAALADNLQRR